MSMKEDYQNNIRPSLKTDLGYVNLMAVPKIVKATVNVGLNKDAKDQKLFDVVSSTLEKITGQKAVQTKARKSISNFKIREGMPIGMTATVRGQRMYDFLEKLVKVALPRIRDFRGLSPKSVDQQGNLSVGFKEHTAWPEIEPHEIDRLHGLEVSITTTAKSQEEGLKLFKALGFPLKDK